MATLKTGFGKYDSHLGILQESTFGTVSSDGSNYEKIDIIGGATPSFDPAFFEDTEMRNRDVNMADVNDYFSTDNGLWQTYQIPDFIAQSDILGQMLYGVTQQVVEAAGTPFLKTYTLDGATNPLFSGNAGFFFTTLIKHPNANESQKLTSCVVDNLRIKFDPTVQGGRCVCSAGLRTAMGYEETSNPSGTNVFSSITVPTFHNGTSTLSIDSLDLVFYSVEITIESRYAWLGFSSGKADNIKYMGSAVVMNAVVKYDANSDVLLRSKGTSLGNVTLNIGTNASAGYFMADTGQCMIREASTDTGDSETPQKVNLTIDMVNDHGGADYVNFEVADAVDQVW